MAIQPKPCSIVGCSFQTPCGTRESGSIRNCWENIINVGVVGMTPSSCYDQPNRPLGYVEDDIKQPILTSNKLIFGQLITCSRKVRILSKNQTHLNLPNIYADAKISCRVGGVWNSLKHYVNVSICLTT